MVSRSLARARRAETESQQTLRGRHRVFYVAYAYTSNGCEAGTVTSPAPLTRRFLGGLEAQGALLDVCVGGVGILVIAVPSVIENKQKMSLQFRID